MGDGAKEHEDMPNGMKVELLIVGKEIGASCIKQSFGKKKTDGKPGKTRHSAQRQGHPNGYDIYHELPRGLHEGGRLPTYTGGEHNGDGGHLWILRDAICLQHLPVQRLFPLRLQPLQRGGQAQVS